MKREELIKAYTEFFMRNGHKRITSASLVPENDPTVLFTTAGMQPLIPFLQGTVHPQGKRLVNVQRCIRTVDLETVGDETHHTLFEMMGNWSLGDYWKQEAIGYTFEFLTKVLGLSKEKLAVSVFEGDKDAPRDEESADIWKNRGIPKERIAYLGKKDNWWGPAGNTGPCGPDTEIFYWKSSRPVPKTFDPENKHWVEIGNNVLLGYNKNEGGMLSEATQKNIDFGGGLERFLAILQNVNDNYETDVWKPILLRIETLTNKKYHEHKKEMRIIADHIKAAVFILHDGIIPSNTEQGYVLRRLIRRAIVYANKLGLQHFTPMIAEPVFEIYKDYVFNKEHLTKELEREEEKFLKTLEKGSNLLERLITKNKQITGKEAFLLFQSYGFPLEMTIEAAQEKKVMVDEEGYQKELIKHQELSRTATKGKFTSGLADHGEQTTKLHSACHLLLEALNRVLGTEVHQKGSNITSERLRFDFSFERKLTEEEIRSVEREVNNAIEQDFDVSCNEVSLEEARKSGARGTFEDKYGEMVRVYRIGTYSNEICTGPHVKRTGTMGTFKITKQESVGSGVRRIKAVLE